jgi:hypothetical protein
MPAPNIKPNTNARYATVCRNDFDTAGRYAPPAVLIKALPFTTAQLEVRVVVVVVPISAGHVRVICRVRVDRG